LHLLGEEDRRLLAALVKEFEALADRDTSVTLDPDTLYKSD
jgi:hypothetical protein